MSLTRLKQENDNVTITKGSSFLPMGQFKRTTIESAFRFAYNISFGKKGEHRSYRSGGIQKRKNGEIFANSFQGKLSEFAVYNHLYKLCDIEIPDLSTYDLGEWDNYDFKANGKEISVKSTKSYGNLLLLERKDFNSKGQYIPNLSKGNSSYDFFILVRVAPNCESLLKKINSLYSDEINEKQLCENIIMEDWKYDIPGFITQEDLLYAIENDYIIKQGQKLNGRTKMDADNYYIQSGDMHTLDILIDLL